MSSIAYLNGEFQPLEETRISVLDRGFLFGDGVYEVIPVYAGRPLRMAEHLSRLGASLAQVQIPDPLSAAQWGSLFHELITKNGGGDLSLYIQVTRGVAPERDHAFPAEVVPGIFLMVSPLSLPLSPDEVEGIAAITLQDNRWSRCNIKTIALLPNILAKQAALDSGALDAILLRDGQVTEATAANVFVVKDEAMYTPPKDQFILAGITRDLIVELAARDGPACHEQAIPEALLRDADEIWITSSTREILPVIELDGVKVGDGWIGPVWRDMMAKLQQYKSGLTHV